MVQILPRNPGFLERIGLGLSEGLPQAIEGFADLRQQQQAANQKQQLLDSLFPKTTKQNNGSFGESIGPRSLEGNNFSPESISDQQLLALNLSGDPELKSAANFIQKQKELAQTERLTEKKLAAQKQQKYFDKNEPQLIEMANTQRNLEQEDMRFARMQELSNDPSKFPSAPVAALFSKGGQLGTIASSLLSPEAQEFVKLVVDSTSAIKDTYGARVTNFDLETYLKKLPSLFNTPEGRERILRDLRIINEINRLHNEGISSIFEEKGGSGAIPFSEAERLFTKQYKDRVDSLKKQFIHGEIASNKGGFSAYKYKGKTIEDPETEERFKSDGVRWVLLD
ncbi:MAG TPA: hypothetical protein VFX43_09430 [Chitinophagaceae bacterium]|nr:hypothetical protein [Chitinophagaceae bacterium]